MMKCVVLMSVLFLSGCYNETTKTNERVNGFGIVCMDGVKYYLNKGNYGIKSLAPVIDAETLTYVRCALAQKTTLRPATAR